LSAGKGPLTQGFEILSGGVILEILSLVAGSITPYTILFTSFGVVLGVFFGAMPGLNGPIGVAVLLPVTYSMNPINGLLTLSGLYMGATYGGSISAILLNCPGTSEASCTALDGFPLARAGRAREALYYSIVSSTIGGLCGVLVMIFCTPILAGLALEFGDAELFLVCVAGLAVVGSIMGKNIFKGFLAVSFGLLLGVIGMDPLGGSYRMTFGLSGLRSGIILVPVSVGLFAVSEMLTLLKPQKTETLSMAAEKTTVLDVLKATLRKYALVLKSALIGTIVGILPGTGGAIAAFIAYGSAKGAKAEDVPFGEGNVGGIIAPETANNAAVGGSFVPLLALGIPGSATSAIIFGALMIHGLNPGPKLFVEHADITYTFMYGMLYTIFLMAVIGIAGVRLFSQVLKIQTRYIIPVVVAFSIIGAYSARNSLYDVGIALFFGLVGLFFKKARIPIAPVILALILGELAEKNLRICITTSAAKGISLFNFIVFRPISIIIIVFIALILYANFRTFKGLNAGG
jgi:putative tricarboxylic transport membrane protein